MPGEWVCVSDHVQGVRNVSPWLPLSSCRFVWSCYPWRRGHHLVPCLQLCSPTTSHQPGASRATKPWPRSQGRCINGQRVFIGSLNACGWKALHQKGLTWTNFVGYLSWWACKPCACCLVLLRHGYLPLPVLFMSFQLLAHVLIPSCSRNFFSLLKGQTYGAKFWACQCPYP